MEALKERSPEELVDLISKLFKKVIEYGDIIKLQYELIEEKDKRIRKSEEIIKKDDIIIRQKDETIRHKSNTIRILQDKVNRGEEISL